MLTLVLSYLVLPLAPAAAVAGITLSKSAPASVRAGARVAYDLVAANPDSNPDAVNEWNLAFRDVLPPGVTYVAGSTTPARAGEPTVIASAAGTTLIWSNVGDLQINSSFALGYSAVPDPAVYPVGSTVTNAAEAHTNTDPFVSPQFDDAGVLDPATATESAADSATSTVSALDVTKSEPSPEGELLRGVHDHPTVYTLRVRTSEAGGTSGVVVTDYLPAELEFLGCGREDNSAGPEYPGASLLTGTPLVPDCTAPDTVTTVVNPPSDAGTTFPPGVYTRLRWNLGDLAPGQEVVLPYAAGIPLRANAPFGPGSAPGVTGQQGSNLDNNTGASTREGPSERSATNRVAVSGSYEGPLAPGASASVTASTTSTVSIEDLRMVKSPSTTTFRAGGIVRYTLHLATSEYTSASGVLITDAVPAGLCPLGGPGTNFAPGAQGPCAGSAATTPSVDYGSVTPRPDGGFTVVFDPVSLPADGRLDVTYDARMLDTYLDGRPTAVGDSFTNRASLAGSTTPIPLTGESGVVTVTDTSSATLTSDGAVPDKTMLARSQSGGTCPTDTSAYAESGDLPAAETRFRAGDAVCFALRVDFSDATRTRNPQVIDFLPAGMAAVAGSVQATAANTAPFSVTGLGLAVVFDIGTPSPNGRFVEQGAVFEVVLQASVLRGAPGPGEQTRTNLMKLGIQDSAGVRQSFRDTLSFTVAPPPPLRVVKGVDSVDVPRNPAPPATSNGPNSNVDGVRVQGGSVATFRIDVNHAGAPGGVDSAPVGGLDVWDVLAPGLGCSTVSNVRFGPAPASAPTVTCTDPGDPGHPTFAGSGASSLLQVTWELAGDVPADEITPGERFTILYDVAVPEPADVSTVYADTAHVRRYQLPTNLTGSDGRVVPIYPKENVDPTVLPILQTAAVARDGSSIQVRSPVVTKTGVTSITEQNNNTPNQATIGELATYRYAVVVPAHTEVNSGSLGDGLPPGFTIEPPATLTFFPDAGQPGTAGPPPGPVLDPNTGTIDFGTEYANTTDLDQRFEVLARVRVGPGALTTTQNAITRTNTARFESLATPGGEPLPGVTAGYGVNVRQPRPDLTKVTDQSGPVPGGTLITFTLVAANQNLNGSPDSRPPLHDAFVVDCVPAGLTFQGYVLNPGRPQEPGTGTNGCAVGTTRLVWSLDDVAAGAPRTLSYTARLTIDAVGSDTYTNTAVLSGSSLDDGKTDPLGPDNTLERSYTDTASATVVVAGAALVKTVTPTAATIGERYTWKVATGALENTTFFSASIIDRIPAGIVDVRLESIDCVVLTTPTTSCGPVTGTPLTPVPQAGGATLYGWTVGDVVVGAQPRGLVAVYSGRVADVPVNVAGRSVVNSAHAAWNLTRGRTPTAADFAFDRQSAPDSATATVLEPRLSVTKAASDPTPDPTQRFGYTVSVSNASGATRSDAFNLVVTDVVPTGVVVDPASISDGGELTGADPVTGGGTITWDAADLPGPLAPGARLDLQYEAVLAPSPTLTAAGLTNTVTVRSYESLPNGGRVYTGPQARATVTPQFPRIVTAKAALDPPPAYLGQPFRWRVTVTNAGGARAFGIDVADTLPPNWSYDAGSATVVVAGGAPQQLEPDSAVGRNLVWTDLGSLAPGQSVVLTYAAVPGPAVVDDPGVGASVFHVNSARGAGVDESDATGNATGPFSGPAATASTRIDSADLVVDKTHVDPFVAGAEATWRVAVRNAGPDVAVGPFRVTDTLPAGVSLVSAAGSGWSCTASGNALDCRRLAPGETLAAGASLPVLSVVVAIPAATAPGTQLTNSATASARTHDPNPGNNTDSDTATVTASADLRIDKRHALDPIAGERVTWTLDVVNGGPSVAAAGTGVTDTLPAGLTFVSATGTGWDCAAVGRLVTCTRALPLPLGAAPQIELVADVASSVTGTLVNTATVTNTTPDPNTGNNSDTDRTPVVVLADLSIEKTHTNDFVAGAQGTYRLVVVNAGPSDAASPVRITDSLPGGLVFASSTDVEGDWSCSAVGQDLTCDLSGALAAGDAASLLVTVDIDPSLDLATPVTNTARVSSPTTDPNLVNNVDSDTTGVDAVVDLAIAKTHTGTAVAGQRFDWTLTVTNNGPSSTPGPIVVTDAVPAGTSYVSATGSGWSCDEDAGLVTCRSDDPIARGDDAPPITVTLLVLPSAGPGTITNFADVSGPIGDPVPENNTATDTVTVEDQTDVAIGKRTVGPGTVNAGETVAFDLTVTNNGPSDADAVVVRDSLPAGTTLVSVTPPDGEGWVCATVGRQVACARATMPAAVGPGTPPTSVIRLVARVASGVPDGTVLTNTANVSTATPGDLPENNTASSTVLVRAVADLALTKVHQGTDPVRAGTTTTFGIDVENLGPSDALGPFTVTDTLPAGLAFVSAAAPWLCTPSDGNAQVVVCETPDVSPLVAGGTAAPLVITVAVDATAAPGTYTNSATVTSPTRDPNPQNDTGTAVVRVVQAADLFMLKTHGGPVRVGDELTFTLRVANMGPSRASGVVVSDPLPAGLAYVSATGDGWACTEAAAVVTCELAAPLEAGDGPADISVVVTVQPGAYPLVANTATVVSVTPDPDLTNNSYTTTVTVPPLVDLAIDKSHTGTLRVGTDAAWTLVVTNAGPTDDPGPLTVVDTVPDGLRPLAATGDGWSCAVAGQVVTCTSDAGLAVGGTSTLTLTTAVLPSAFPAVTNTATVGSPAEDRDPTNNVDTDSAGVEALSKLVIDKELTDQSAGSGTFAIIVTNAGPNDTTAPIVVTDPLPEGMTPVQAGGPGWSCGIVQSTVTCQYTDTVVVDDSTAPLVVRARVTATPGTALVNVAVVDGGQPNPCSTCGSTDHASLVVPAEHLAQTGTELVRLALMALLLVGGGLLLVRLGRARQPHRS